MLSKVRLSLKSRSLLTFLSKNRQASQVVTMPALSPTMTSGKIAKWTKKAGDKVTPGETIGEVETDKASVDFVFQDEGFIAKFLVKEGAEDVPVGSPVCIVVDEASEIAAAQAAPSPTSTTISASPKAVASVSTTSAVGAVETVSSHHEPLDNSKVLPSARMLMDNHGLAISAVKQGTGRGGRITKGDVLVHLGKLPASALQSTTTETHTPAIAAQTSIVSSISTPSLVSSSSSSSSSSSVSGRSYTDTKPSQVRKVIATRLTESKAGIPHQYALMDCKIDAMMALRAQLKSAGITVSVNDMIIKAAARALRDVPEANCFYDSKSDSVKQHPNGNVDISVAVSTDGGLITPIVKNADTLGLLSISEKVKELAGRARLNKLKPEEFIGGSFTVSNLGMFGIDYFSAVINPPQACILAVGKGEKKVVLPSIKSFDDIKPGAPVPPTSTATIMTVQLSSDARVVDPAIAGQFLQVFKTYIENPTYLTA